ncbi:HAD-like protein [Phlegmacium glaucopus]|nr:HAD-like protein [Phlegmacium glaucopus]
MSSSPQVFYADAVLFDMDGTLTDSISAVEAAWGKFAQDIGEDPGDVIAATHGKRAVDNLSHFKPHMKEHEVDDEVTKFEESILFFADAHRLHGPRSKFRDQSGLSSIDQTPIETSPNESSITTPSLATPSLTTPSLTREPSPPLSVQTSNDSKRLSFGHRLLNLLNFSVRSGNIHIQKLTHYGETIQDDDFVRESDSDCVEKNSVDDVLEAWQLEAASVDRAVQILPGVKKIMASIPAGRYAVATSGAKTYAYGCMSRAGIIPPPVTITADDKRLKAGKPAPDPFLLAADCLGYDARKCVVFEDSPSGIRAGLASGATVIAVCTSHERSKIENCGAHYIVENMDHVTCEVEGDRLKFSVVV